MRLTLSVVLLLSIVSSNFTCAQFGGESVFSSLNLPFSARQVASGGNLIAVFDGDLNLGLQTPSLLNKSHDQRVSFSHSFLAGGINYGQFGYARQIKDSEKFWSTAFRYVGYGSMPLTLPTGEEVGTFSAGDLIASAGYGQRMNEVLSIGANLNFALSSLQSFQSIAATVDFSGTLNFDEHNLTMTALVRNAGVQIVGYTSGNREQIRPNPMLAITHKLKHAPFRVGLVAQHLNRWDIAFYDRNAEPTIDPFTNEIVEPFEPNVLGKAMHHVTLHVEALFGKLFSLQAGFDYRQREHMKVQNRHGLSGFSFGLALNLKKFQFQYGFNAASAAGFNNMFTLSSNIHEWKK